MRRYNTRFSFYITQSLRQGMKKRSKELDITISDYIRTLIKKDLKESSMADSIVNTNKISYDINLYNKKLSGYYKEL